MNHQSFFGEHHHLLFVKEGGRIIAIWDRARRKSPVTFSESELIDLSHSLRESAETYMGGQSYARPKISGSYELEGEGKMLIPLGFGRGLHYHTLKSVSGTAAVSLTVNLPERVAYRIDVAAKHVEGNQLTLEEGITITIFTDLHWEMRESAIFVQTGEEAGEITFLVHSTFEQSRVQDVVIVAAEGWERDAMLARAACGKGFVRCFVVNNTRHDENVGKLPWGAEQPGRLICLGLSHIRLPIQYDARVVEVSLRSHSSADLARQWGAKANGLTIIAPSREDAYGPALLLALHHEANLQLEDTQDDSLYLVDGVGQRLKTWSITELIGVPLNVMTDTARGTSDVGELVICESTLRDLVVCQGVGYAEMEGLHVAFIPPVHLEPPPEGFPDSTAGIRELERMSRAAVPLHLRNPHAGSLTVFTKALPLHLTKTEESLTSPRWFDRYAVSHLPGQSASHLIGRLASVGSRDGLSVPFSVIFDALCEAVDTEGHVFARELERGLSYPIVLSGMMAQRDILRELTHRLATDLILLITHGAGDSITDGLGEELGSKEIGGWRLRGTPLVFNNSCTSWATTGNAFLAAEARALIATMWPVRNDVAAALAAKIGDQLHGSEGRGDVLGMFVDSVRELTQAWPAARDTLSAYVFIGSPQTRLLTQPLTGVEETLNLLTEVFSSLYNVFIDLAANGRPDLALNAYKAVSHALFRRFKSLIEPGEVPRPLSPPFQIYTLLEVDLLFASADFGFHKAVISHIPHEEQEAHIRRMDYELSVAINELTTWNERHDRHFGRTREQRENMSEKAGMFIGALGDGMLYKLLVQAVYTDVLPFITTLAGIHARDRAQEWLKVATIMVTTPRDLSPDGTVSDEALIERVKEGNKERMRVISFSNDAAEDEIFIDLLQDFNRADLLNRFGIACKYLREYDRALSFYNAALGLAEPGSNDHANIRSNIANVLRELGGSDEALGEMQHAFIEQERQKDYRNAVVTAANMLRLAASTGVTADESVMAKALEWADAAELSAERLKRRADLLGATACYYASRGLHDKVLEIRNDIARLLQLPFPPPDVEVHLNELVGWYSDTGLHAKSVELALANAADYQAANLPDVAARTYVAAGCAAISAYLATRNKYFLSTFLDCAAKVGKALRLYPSLQGPELQDFVGNMWENLTSMWQQCSEFGETRLAVMAYETLKVWEPGQRHPDWELASRAFDEKNVAFVRRLAAAGAIKREAIISISQDLDVTIETATRRHDGGSALGPHEVVPQTVYGYWPLHKPSTPSEKVGTQMSFIAGAAVYPLRSGESATVVESDLRVLRTDGHGTYLYQDIYGSRDVEYRLLFRLDPGLIPVDLTLYPKSGPVPQSTIRFGKHSCEIRVEGRDENRTAASIPWMADVRLVFRTAPELTQVLWDESSPFASTMPFEMYMTFLRLLSKR